MGDDGTFWGGEVLARGPRSATGAWRASGGHRCPAARSRCKRPYRMALGYLLGAEALGAADVAGIADARGLDGDLADSFLARLDPREVGVVRTQVARGLNAPVASSAGRLFDAAAASSASATSPSTRRRRRSTSRSRPAIGRPRRCRTRIAAGRRAARLRPAADARGAARRPGGRSAAVGPLAARVPRDRSPSVTRELCRRRRGIDAGMRTVCLSGGVFQNRRLAVDARCGGLAARRLRGLHQPPGPGQRRRHQLRSGGGRRAAMAARRPRRRRRRPCARRS